MILYNFPRVLCVGPCDLCGKNLTTKNTRYAQRTQRFE